MKNMGISINFGNSHHSLHGSYRIYIHHLVRIPIFKGGMGLSPQRSWARRNPRHLRSTEMTMTTRISLGARAPQEFTKEVYKYMEDERPEPTAITHKKRGNWSEPNLQGIMFHVNPEGCTTLPKKITEMKVGIAKRKVYYFQGPVYISKKGKTSTYIYMASPAATWAEWSKSIWWFFATHLRFQLIFRHIGWNSPQNILLLVQKSGKLTSWGW